MVETVEQVGLEAQSAQDRNDRRHPGRGEIGTAIIENLKEKGYRAVGIDIQIVDGRVEIGAEGMESPSACRLIVVQTPPRDDVVPYYENLKKTAILIDDAHPRITVRPKEIKFYKVAIGRPGVQFWPPCPATNITGSPAASGIHGRRRDEQPRHDAGGIQQAGKGAGFFAPLIDDR